LSYLALYYNRLSNSDLVKRTLSGSFWSLLGAGVSRISNLASMTIIARLLNEQGFGLVSIVIQTMGVLGVFAGAGMGATLTRFVAQHRDSDPQRAGRIVSLLVIVSAAAFLFAASGLSIFADQIAIRVFQEDSLSFLLQVGILVMLTSIVRTLLDGILAGLENFKAISISSMAHGVSTLVACAALTFYAGEAGALMGIAIGYLISSIVAYCFLIEPLRRFRVVSGVHSAFSEFKVLGSFAGPSILTGVVYAPFAWLALALLARVDNGVAEAGGYQAAYIWHGPIMFFPMTIASVSIPTLTRAWENHEISKFGKIILFNIGIMLFISITLSALVIMFSERLIGLSGQEFVRFVGALVVLAIAAPVHGAARVLTSAMYAMGNAWGVFFINVGAGLALTISAIFLVDAEGARGLAKSLLASQLFLALFFTIFVAMRYTRANARS